MKNLRSKTSSEFHEKYLVQNKSELQNVEFVSDCRTIDHNKRQGA